MKQRHGIPLQRLTTTVFLLFSAGIYAQDAGPDCSVVAYDGTLFADVYQQAASVSNELCAAFESRFENGAANTERLESVLQTFLDNAQQSLGDKGLAGAADYAAEFDKVSARFSIINLDNLDLPNFIVNPPLFSGDATGEFESGYSGFEEFTIPESGFCEDLPDVSSCQQAFEEFSYAFNPYRSAWENLFANNTETLDALASRWDKFLEASKSQTALEVILTTALHRNYFAKDYLVGPPPSQVIALHPDLVYETIDTDLSGSTADLGLSIEWIGINWWDMKVPFGISLASVYVDHNGASDVGHGIQLHFDNRYSIGWARHHHDDGFYFNIDILKFFESRQSKYRKYLENYF